MPTTPQRGDFVRVRTRRWLVEDERSAGDGLTALRLACVDDDAQGEAVEVLWDAELDGSVLKDEGWASVAKFGTDDASVFSAYLRALRWNTATAATPLSIQRTVHRCTGTSFHTAASAQARPAPPSTITN